MEFLIIAGIVVFFVLVIVFWSYIDNQKQKASKKAWYAAKKETANSLKSATFWIKENPQLTNFLWIVAHSIDNFDHFDIDRVRRQITQLGDTKVHDLPIEQRKEYFPEPNTNQNEH